jgi:Ran GTPase-activating protein (RanGAP) involved in mRNA processing and transport
MTSHDDSKKSKVKVSQPASDEQLQKMRVLVSRVFYDEEGLIFGKTEDSYNKLELVSKEMRAAMKKAKPDRSVTLNRTYWEHIPGASSIKERQQIIIAQLERAQQKCSIVKLVLPEMQLTTKEPNFLNVLTSITTLQHLDLSKNYIDIDESIGLSHALTRCQALTRLDLRSNKIGVGMSRFAEVLSRCPKLESLDLYNNEIRNHGATSILRYCTTLTDLNLQLNLISSINHEALCTSLMKLNLSQNDLDHRSDFGLVFKNCSALRYLNLFSNPFKKVKRLITYLPKWPSLTELDLSHCRINDLGMTIFAEVLPKCTSLTHLDLSFNRIGIPGVQSLTEKLRDCTSLKILNLRGSTDDPQVIEHLRDAWPGPAEGLFI